MYQDANTRRPLSIKLALVSAAVGAGFVAPAHAAFISTAPAGFAPLTFSTSTLSTYSIDLDKNGVTDYTISTSSSYVTISGTSASNQIDAFGGSANPYANTASFLSANSIKGFQNASLYNENSTYPYVELVFADQAGDLTRGYLEGTATYANGIASYTLTDFGMETTGTVPEPGSLALLAAGAVGIGALRRRRRSTRAL